MSMEVASSDTLYITQPKHSFWALNSPGEKRCIIIIAGISTLLAIVFCISTIAVASRARYEPKCVFLEGNNKKERVQICSTAECKQAAQVILNKMDDSKDPCEDFYSFSCGKFVTNTTIPAGIDNMFMMVQLDMILKLRAIYDQTPPSTENRNATSIALHLYKKCLDQEKEHATALKSLEPLVRSILKTNWPIASKDWNEADFSWEQSIAMMLREYDQNFVFSFKVQPDIMYPSNYTPQLLMGLPGTGIVQEKFYYSDQTSAENVKKVVCMVNPNCEENGQLQDDIKNLVDVLSREHLLLTGSSLMDTNMVDGSFPDMFIQRSPAADMPKVKYTISELKSNINGVKWDTFFQVLFENTGVTVNDRLEITTDLALTRQIVTSINSYGKRQLASYIGWKFLQNWGTILSTDISSIMYPKKDRIDVCRDFLDTVMGFAVGKMYIDKYLTDETIQEVSTLTNDIQKSFESIVSGAGWMDSGTRDTALRKVKNMKKTVASPNWVFNEDNLNLHYKELNTIPDVNFQDGATLAKRAYITNQIKLFHKKVDRENDWILRSPVLVNAFNVRNTNTMVYPLGILHNAMFNNGRPRAVNFGSFGYIAGHEVTHGFDSTGKLFDENGALRSWWSAQADQKFLNGANCFVDQYSSITDEATNLKLNGTKTLAENIADNGGLRAAFKAYKEVGLQQGGRMKYLEKYSEDQLFFIAAAQTWCSRASKETLEKTIKTSDHSPDKYRAYVPFQNFPEFAKAFSCKDGAKMNPKDRCRIW